MAYFRYQALNAHQQLVNGQLQADSVTLAVAELELQGLVVQSINHVPAVPAMVIGPAVDERPATSSLPESSLEHAALRGHIERMLQRGKTMVPALTAMAEELPAGRERRQFETVLKVLDRGDASEALAAFDSLPEYWIALLSAASAANDPQRVLREFLRESQQATELRRQWWQALAYPLLILALAGGVLTLLSFLIVPTFRTMFVEFALALPWLTLIVFQLAAEITSGRIVLFMALAAAAIWLMVYASRWLPVDWRIWWSDQLGTPLGRAAALARLTQFTAHLLEAGLDPPSALRIAGHASQSSRLQRASWRLARDVERNEGLPVRHSGKMLTQTVLHIVRTPMPPESRIRLLQEVSRSYAERASVRWSWTRGLIEPLAICVVGLVVGTVVLSLFLPLISLVHGLSGG